MVSAYEHHKEHRHEQYRRILLAMAGEERTNEEHVSGYHVRQRVKNALTHTGNSVLWHKIKACSRSSRCQSLWCGHCRNSAANAVETQIRKRLIDEEAIFGGTSLDRTSSEFNDHMNANHRHVSGYVGVFSLDQASVLAGLQFDRKRWKKLKERKTDRAFWIAGNYEMELVNYRFLVSSLNTESKKKQKQIAQLLSYSRDMGWINKGDNVGVLLHWHAVTNATEEALEDVLGDAYWLDGERLYKTSAPGVYVQSLHSNKSFDVNIGKMASYALKSATRYKHTFIGSDFGNELMLQSELSGLINLYHQIQKRNWRALLFTHTIGSREMTVLSNKEADSSD